MSSVTHADIAAALGCENSNEAFMAAIKQRGAVLALLRERLQAIVDWADLALENPATFDSHGVRNLYGPVFDDAREALSDYPDAVLALLNAPASGEGGAVAARERLAQELALIQVEGSGPDAVSHYDWNSADRLWRQSFYKNADRLLRVAAPVPPASDEGSATFQSRVDPWLIACFGLEIARNREERNHRFIEEALELVQANGCTQSEAHQLVDYVYGRPAGDPAQEVGGVMNTLAALCLASGLDMHKAGEVELARVWTKVEQIRAKQAAKPQNSPLPETTAPVQPAPAMQAGWMSDLKERARAYRQAILQNKDALQSLPHEKWVSFDKAEDAALAELLALVAPPHE